MSLTVAVLFAVLLHGRVTLASDPDPVRDFCIANTDSATNIPCKNSSDATVEDFIFSGIKSRGRFSETGLASIPVNVNSFPGLNTLGVSLVRADFEAGGVNVPHFHPRATEVAGLVHFQMNVGDKPATILGSFDSENPGLMKIPAAVFGCGIKEELLEKAFGLTAKDISKVRRKLTLVLERLKAVVRFSIHLIKINLDNASGNINTIL
ncbi:hypothetical protein OIU84_020441 [Salix udensis]|uniref:Cupin type-1 domain-containing protein n=1 Tax=Salix udensis TaxID=889485 RepID=A0AAD6PGB0_9ROSI|nr:hypothetical protein OIU84_020441 [Salix udensis]